MTQQIIYVAGALICMFLAYKVMAKVKDLPPPPEENEDEVEEETPESTEGDLETDRN